MTIRHCPLDGCDVRIEEGFTPLGEHLIDGHGWPEIETMAAMATGATRSVLGIEPAFPFASGALVGAGSEARWP